MLRCNLRPAKRPKKTELSVGEQKAEYELTKGWREFHKDEIDKMYFSTNYQVDKVQESEKGEERGRIWQSRKTGVKGGVEAN